MLKSYEAIYDNDHLNWLGEKPSANRIKVIVIVEEKSVKKIPHHSIQQLKGIAPKPDTAISLDEMNIAIQLEGAKH